MGSARVSRADSGGSPESSFPHFLKGKKFGLQSFRRAAENGTPAACAPQKRVAQATRLSRPATGRTEWKERPHWKQTFRNIRPLSSLRATGRRSGQASGLCYPFNCRAMSKLTNMRRIVRYWVMIGFLSIGFSSRADVILDWNALALDCIRADTTSPTLSSRNLAILHTAIYDAVNSITRTHQTFRFQLHAPTNASPEAAAVAAAYEVIADLYPSLAPWADDLYDSYLASATPGPALTNGLNLGWEVALLTLDSRNNDGSSTEVPYIPSNDAGQWQRTPPFYRPPLTPHWGFVDTFCLPDIEPFVPGPPPALDSSDYAVALNEVKALGGKTNTTRTTEQSQIAVFWSDFSYTAMPPGHWHEIAASIAQSRTNTLEQNARLFALMSLAQADAAIVCWEAKYRYNLWRPITAIRRADEDGNSATEKDAAWDHYLAAPPFPSYMSGHSTFSKASAQVLTHFYGTDAINFIATSDSLPGVVRSFSSLAVCADEVGMSRIYGGIHFQFDNVEGKLCGQKIGDYITANFLLENDRLPLLKIQTFSNQRAVLQLHGRIGTTYLLEASTDLTHWKPIYTNSAVSGGLIFNDLRAATNQMQFYRLVEAN